jgi:hypothetical protein
VWAAVGAAFIVLQLWIYGSWLAAGDIAAQPAGPTPMPGWMQPTIRAVEAGSTTLPSSLPMAHSLRERRLQVNIYIRR